MSTVQLLIIGFGPHARRIYYPIIKNEEQTLRAKIVCAVDIISQKPVIDEYFSKRLESLPMFYVNHPHQGNTLNKETLALLEKIIHSYHIQGVIISTEPLAHVAYAQWALQHNLSVLMDKPISTQIHASTSVQAAQKIITDYEELKQTYLQAKKRDKTIQFTLMAQRRYHPAFQKMKDLVHEITSQTNCPITSIQSFHSDGQWRLPSEIIDIKYHSFNNGYGKCSHTGYHALDIVPWLLEGSSTEKQIDNVDVFANFLRPNDFIHQINLDDYHTLFPNFPLSNKYSNDQFTALTSHYGEIDAFNSFAFKHGNEIMTLGSVNLVHNGFSQRGWLQAKPDLYKGNGRVRHESHFIEQGPFQSISFISYQSNEVDPNNKKDIYDVGGEYHLDIHVFRNRNFNSSWNSYDKYSIKDLHANIVKGFSRGHQEDARRACIIEFIEHLHGNDKTSLSDYLEHEKGTYLLAGIYISAAKKFHNQNPLVNIKL